VAPNGEVDARTWQLGAFEAAGGLYASLDDLAAIAPVPFGDSPSVLSERSVAEWMHDDSLPGSHGVAWSVREIDGAPVVTHTGSTSDYSGAIVVFPTARLGAVVLTPGSDDELPSCVARGLFRIAFDGQAPPSCVPPPIDEATR